MLFISLELVSAPGFLMSAFRKGDIRSNEAGLKFFMIGVLSTAVMLYGMSLIYGLTGRHAARARSRRSSREIPADQETLAFAAILFVVVGFAFKVSAVPFQFWAPDTYEGSPVPVAAFLAVASSAAGFAGLLQLMFVAFIDQHDVLGADLRVPVGRHDVRGQPGRAEADAGGAAARVLGDRAGRLHPADVRAGDRRPGDEPHGVLVRGRLHPDLRHHDAGRVRGGGGGEPAGSDVANLGLRRARQDGSALLAVGMTVFMISLAGVPPTGGFWAKLLIFRAAIDRGGSLGVIMAVIMLVNSVISVFYYFAVPRQMIFRDPDDDARLRVPSSSPPSWPSRWSPWC